MPLIEPPEGLREKILEIGGAGAGKTTDWLSIAWWAKQSDDTRKFYVCDTDDEAVLQVMNESKYDGMVRSFNDELINEDGNVIVYSCVDWPQYEEFSAKAVANAVKGDWIVLDFITHAWTAVQEGYLKDAVQKTRGEALYEAGVSGLSGWDMFKVDFNWPAINGSYFDFIKPILVKSRAHVFMTAEEEEIFGNKLTDDQREHIAQFGKYKAVGQKKLPYQCRTYLRKQRLARGRVLYTLKDRARPEMNGETCAPDFFSYYLKGAGWTVA